MASRSRDKAIARKENKDQRPFAVAKYIRISPSKVRIVIDLIRGKNYFDALAILENTPKAASLPVKKLLNSAAANAEVNKGMSKDDLYVAEIFADNGPTLKRVMPRAQGRAFRILKRTSHITVILDSVSNK
ncbi:MAG: 50S ribosomal protein L22 [Clostridia bacterium]|nr:50S ribosomal protein L22 [Clostridia bacterium]MBR2303247.1 50S ribosomal protein L22 [Clostridia bacterium]MBR2371613.1 50S ribosomal protein L22 [Clostridia bacterium]MBR4847092.1 50S ribosomal protein L22 [Phascolarctobacterium sp.]